MNTPTSVHTAPQQTPALSFPVVRRRLAVGRKKVAIGKKQELTQVLRRGDCLKVLSRVPDQSVQLIVTSPPYAEKRKNTYGGIHADQYVDWLIPRAAEFMRVLRPDGTFILNIKEHANQGERHPYVLELILALRKQGWLWTEEFVWHKKNCYPGKWPNRFRDGWERLLQFNLQRKFKMNQDAVRVPVGKWKESRLSNPGKNDNHRLERTTGSGFGVNMSNWKDTEFVLPSNVLHLATECGNKKHSAVFPEPLAAWFIRLFSDPGDWVLDPFLGSGTTAVAARRLERRALGVDILPENITLAQSRLAKIRKEKE